MHSATGFSSVVGVALVCAVQFMVAAKADAQPRPVGIGTAALFGAADTPALPGPTQGSQPSQRENHAVMWGALSGAVTAAAVTFTAAARYGRNEGAEGGRMCGRCFLEWSSITVPVGTGIGAAIGFAVQQIRRQTAPRPVNPSGIVISPIIGKRGGGVIVSTRF